MGTPAAFLPPTLSDESILALTRSINLPPPTKITSHKAIAQYHSIYILTFAANALRQHTNSLSAEQQENAAHTDLILRVSGTHLPKIKTENEVAVMAWVERHTSIPIPTILHYDSSPNNPIAHEYMLLSRVAGVSVDQIYWSLGRHELHHLVDQMTDILVQLHETEWQHIGGLQVTASGDIVPGPVVEETFWQVPDIDEYWNGTETVETLNIAGPFESYVDYISAHIRKYMYAISKHESLSFMRGDDTLTRLEKFVNVIADPAIAVELNRVKLRLAHKDLHFGNVMMDVASGKITAVLDWEFAGVVPFTRWDPVGAFLGESGNHPDEMTREESRVMKERFLMRCDERGIGIPKDAEYSSAKQESMQLAANFLRAIVEIAPRGHKAEMVGSWKETLLHHVSAFGV